MKEFRNIPYRLGEKKDPPAYPFVCLPIMWIHFLTCVGKRSSCQGSIRSPTVSENLVHCSSDGTSHECDPHPYMLLRPQFADCFNEVKRLTNVDTYDGFRFDLQKPLTPTFVVQVC